jgi:hypothetical protein
LLFGRDDQNSVFVFALSKCHCHVINNKDQVIQRCVWNNGSSILKYDTSKN